MDEFARHKMADCLIAQAHLCERIAGQCADKAAALKFRQLADECRAAAPAKMAAHREHSVAASFAQSSLTQSL
jgi:hypothetical protein